MLYEMLLFFFQVTALGDPEQQSYRLIHTGFVLERYATAVLAHQPKTGPRPASSMPRQQSSVLHMSGIGEARRQLTVLSASNSLRSMTAVDKHRCVLRLVHCANVTCKSVCSDAHNVN